MAPRLAKRLTARLRWSGRATLMVVGFTLAVCLAIGGSILLLFGVVWFVDSIVGHTDVAGLVGLGVFVATIVLSVQLLVHLSDRLQTDEHDESEGDAGTVDADRGLGQADQWKRGGTTGKGEDGERRDGSPEREAEARASDGRSR